MAREARFCKSSLRSEDRHKMVSRHRFAARQRDPFYPWPSQIRQREEFGPVPEHGCRFSEAMTPDEARTLIMGGSASTRRMNPRLAESLGGQRSGGGTAWSGG